MKSIAAALILLGIISGCARNQSPSPGASPTERPDLMYKSPTERNTAGHTWNTTMGVCM